MADAQPGDGAQTVEKLTEQVDNLNKGIATYRDKEQAAVKIAEEKTKEADTFKSEVERLKKEAAAKGPKEKGANLAPEDEEKLASWAKEHGFVTKEELEVEKSRLFNEGLKNIESQAIDEFIKSHPEYDNDDEWDKVKKEFVQYKQPTSITAYRQLLTKIHKELKGDEDAAAKARATEETRKRLGLGGGNGGTAATDTTLEALREKYPNLSEDMIQSRLEEINKLAKDREERNKARKK